MPEPSDSLRNRLEALARSLDNEAPTIPTTEITSGAPPRGRTPQRALLVAAAAVLAVLAGTLAVTARGHDDRTHVVGPGPDSTGTTRPAESALDWDKLPPSGIAVQPDAGPVQIYDLAGTLLGTTPAPDSGTDLRPEADLVLNRGLIPGMTASVQVPEGCTSALAGGGRRVALCGGYGAGPSRIELVDSAGTETTLVDGTLEPEGGVGHWVWAIPSPDGAWVLAQWSGECEAPHAWIISTTTAAARSIAGSSPDRPHTQGLGWTPDGRAIVDFRSGGCGPDMTQPGTYLVNTSDLAKDLAVPAQGGSLTYAWRSRTAHSPLEALIQDAGIGSGLEACCAAFSDGGPGVNAGFVYDGYEISVTGFPTASGPYPFEVEQRIPFASGEAAILSSGTPSSPGQGTAVAFTCGANTWWLGWKAASTPEIDSMLLLGEQLLPRLGCTLGPPPTTTK